MKYFLQNHLPSYYHVIASQKKLILDFLNTCNLIMCVWKKGFSSLQGHFWKFNIFLSHTRGGMTSKTLSAFDFLSYHLNVESENSSSVNLQ